MPDKSKTTITLPLDWVQDNMTPSIYLFMGPANMGRAFRLGETWCAEGHQSWCSFWKVCVSKEDAMAQLRTAIVSKLTGGAINNAQ